MSTDVEISNMALSMIGQSEISSLAGTDNVSKTCNVHFQQAVDWVLRQREWKDAVYRAALSTPDGTPAYGWDHYYDQPASCLRVLDVRATQLEDYAENPDPWSFERGRIYCNIADGIKVKYLTQLAATSLPSHVVDVVALELARRICIPITQSSKMLDDLNVRMFGVGKEDKGVLGEAAAIDGMQGRNMKVRSSNLVKVRMQGTFLAGPYVYDYR